MPEVTFFRTVAELRRNMRKVFVIFYEGKLSTVYLHKIPYFATLI